MKKHSTIIIGLFSIGVFFISSCTKTPTPCFSVDKGGVVKTNEEVQFDGSCSSNTTSYTWDFGDGTSATGNPVKHKYSTAATYAIKLTATNKKKSKTLVQDVTINP
jgi:PKD repeat protein